MANLTTVIGTVDITANSKTDLVAVFRELVRAGFDFYNDTPGSKDLGDEDLYAKLVDYHGAKGSGLHIELAVFARWNLSRHLEGLAKEWLQHPWFKDDFKLEFDIYETDEVDWISQVTIEVQNVPDKPLVNLVNYEDIPVSETAFDDHFGIDAVTSHSAEDLPNLLKFLASQSLDESLEEKVKRMLENHSAEELFEKWSFGPTVYLVECSNITESEIVDALDPYKDLLVDD